MFFDVHFIRLTINTSVPDARGLENKEVSCAAAGLSISVAGEVGRGIRSPAEESWPLRRWEGGEVGPSLLAAVTEHKKKSVMCNKDTRYLQIIESYSAVNSRVAGLGVLPRLRPGVDVGEDIVAEISIIKEDLWDFIMLQVDIKWGGKHRLYSPVVISFPPAVHSWVSSAERSWSSGIFK